MALFLALSQPRQAHPKINAYWLVRRPREIWSLAATVTGLVYFAMWRAVPAGRPHAKERDDFYQLGDGTLD